MKALGVGVLGYGFMGKTHVYAHRTIPLYYDPPPVNCRMVAICEATDELAHAAQEAGEFRRGDAEDVAWAIVGPFEVARGMSLCHPEMDFGRDRLLRLLQVVFEGVSANNAKESE